MMSSSTRTYQKKIFDSTQPLFPLNLTKRHFQIRVLYHWKCRVIYYAGSSEIDLPLASFFQRAIISSHHNTKYGSRGQILRKFWFSLVILKFRILCKLIQWQMLRIEDTASLRTKYTFRKLILGTIYERRNKISRTNPFSLITEENHQQKTRSNEIRKSYRTN